MVKVYCASVRQSAPDSEGATLTVIGERETLLYEGAPRDVAAYLRALPIGVSVAVRHSKGLRSCMNKPSLWQDVENLESEGAL